MTSFKFEAEFGDGDMADMFYRDVQNIQIKSPKTGAMVPPQFSIVDPECTATKRVFTVEVEGSLSQGVIVDLMNLINQTAYEYNGWRVSGGLLMEPGLPDAGNDYEMAHVGDGSFHLDFGNNPPERGRSDSPFTPAQISVSRAIIWDNLPAANHDDADSFLSFYRNKIINSHAEMLIGPIEGGKFSVEFTPGDDKFLNEELIKAITRLRQESQARGGEQAGSARTR